MSALPPLSVCTEAPSGFNTPSYVRGIERLLRAARDLALARTQADVQRIVSNAARELAGSDGAAFVVRDDGKCFYADEDAIAPLWKGHAFPIEICISGFPCSFNQINTLYGAEFRAYKNSRLFFCLPSQLQIPYRPYERHVH